jgi:hypothetical protein
MQTNHNPNIFKLFRFITLIFGIFFIFLTVIFYTRSDLATAIWPWSYTTLSPLSYTFIASITIAIAMPSLWIAITGELGATFGGALDLAIFAFGSSIYMFQSYGVMERERVLVGAIVTLLLAVFSLAACVISYQFPFKDTRPMPRLLRYSFAFFGLTLIVAGIGLVLKQPVFPWRLSGEASIIYGWIFLGAAAYFWYGFFRPVLGNANGQFLGFLVYDLILIGPFLAHLNEGEPQYRLSLLIYLTVIIYSGVLAIYYLLISPETRVWQRKTLIVSEQPAG